MSQFKWSKTKRERKQNAHVSWQQRQLYDQLVSIYGKEDVFLEHWYYKYRLDIYVVSERLAFELDDESHNFKQRYDRRRDRDLAQCGEHPGVRVIHVHTGTWKYKYPTTLKP